MEKNEQSAEREIYREETVEIRRWEEKLCENSRWRERLPKSLLMAGKSLVSLRNKNRGRRGCSWERDRMVCLWVLSGVCRPEHWVCVNSECNEMLSKGVRPHSDEIWFTCLKTFSDCCMESRLKEGRTASGNLSGRLLHYSRWEMREWGTRSRTD